MKELIKIRENENGEKVVSARDLYEYLEVKTAFTHWAKRMFEYGFEEGEDFLSFLAESIGGRPSLDYILSLDCAKEISMIQRSEKGKQARRYFIACEKLLHQIKDTQLTQANAALKQRYKKSIRLKEVDRNINELMRERKHLIKEINHIDRTSIVYLDLFDNTDTNLFLGGFPNRRIV